MLLTFASLTAGSRLFDHQSTVLRHQGTLLLFTVCLPLLMERGGGGGREIEIKRERGEERERGGEREEERDGGMEGEKEMLFDCHQCIHIIKSPTHSLSTHSLFTG